MGEDNFARLFELGRPSKAIAPMEHPQHHDILVRRVGDSPITEADPEVGAHGRAFRASYRSSRCARPTHRRLSATASRQWLCLIPTPGRRTSPRPCHRARPWRATSGKQARTTAGRVLHASALRFRLRQGSSHGLTFPGWPRPPAAWLGEASRPSVAAVLQLPRRMMNGWVTVGFTGLLGCDDASTYSR
jgi:hypothetical protein